MNLPFYVIGTATGFIIQLNGSGRAEISISLPNFKEHELVIEVIDD